MSEKAMRARFQIHLSTAIVLMFTAGGLLWANFAAYKKYLDSLTYATNWASGWPFPILMWYSDDNSMAIQHESIIWPGVTVNLLAAAVILTIIAVICEKLVRRREARNSFKSKD